MSNTNDPATPAQRRSALIAHTRTLNENSLSRVMLDFKLVLPGGGKGWRPTKRVRGNISGLEHLGELEVLCTDGIVGFFEIKAQSPTCLYGHVDSFSEKVETLHSTPSEAKTPAKPDNTGPGKGSKKPTAPRVTVFRALDLLLKLTHSAGEKK